MKIITLLSFLFLISCRPTDSDLQTGVDFKGKEKSCAPMDKKVCTKIFTPSDEFGMNCQDQGKLAVQCDCHDWICVDKKKN